MKTAIEMHEISDTSIIKNLSREAYGIINSIQEVINIEARKGEYHLFIPRKHELFPHIARYDIKKVLGILGYEIETHEQQLYEYEYNIIGYTIKW